jgi:hypothetical protein
MKVIIFPVDTFSANCFVDNTNCTPLAHLKTCVLYTVYIYNQVVSLKLHDLLCMNYKQDNVPQKCVVHLSTFRKSYILRI